MRKVYNLTQPKKYLLSSEIENNQLKLIGKSLNYPISSNYMNSFSLEDLKGYSNEFRKCPNIKDARQLINNRIEQNKFIVREADNVLNLEIFNPNATIPTNVNLSPESNYNYLIKRNYQINNPRKRVRKETLILTLSPKRKNTINVSSSLKDQNYINIQQNNSPSNLSTNLSSPNSSPIREEINNNSSSENEVIIEGDNNLEAITKINNLENENNALKVKINSLNKQLNDLTIENQNNINNLKSLENQTYSFQNTQKEIENLKTINSQLSIQNNNLKNQINQLNLNSDITLIKGEIIKSQTELDFLVQSIPKNYKYLTLNLIYKASVDSDEARIFHKKCDYVPSSIVLIETDKNARFGGFTSQNWYGNCEEKLDQYAFVFSLNRLEKYDIINGEKAIGCYPKFGPVFLGCQIKINDNAFTNGGTTFLRNANYQTTEDFVLTGGEQKFKVKEIEVYSVELD